MIVLGLSIRDALTSCPLRPPFPLVKSYKDAANEVLGDVGLVRLLGEVAESEKDNILTCITSMDRQVAFRYAQR